MALALGSGIVARDASVNPMVFWRAGFFLSVVILNSWPMEMGARSDSLRNKKLTSAAIREKVAGTAQGRK